MISRSRSFAFLGCAALCASVAACQKPAPPRPAQGPEAGPPTAEAIAGMVKRGRKEFFDHLAMTPDQITKYEKMEDKYAEMIKKKNEEIQTKYGDPRESKEARTELSTFHEKVRTDKEKEILALLKPDQQKKYFAHKAGKR